jgi:CheY-like chemotaxis protein
MMGAVKSKILVVDDNEFIRALLLSRLEAAGYEVVAVDGGQAALEMMSKGLPDLVLLDVAMAGMDGFETGKKIRETYGLDGPAIVMVTAQGQHESVVRAFKELGVIGYVVKPFKPIDLLSEIEKVLKKKAA